MTKLADVAVNPDTAGTDLEVTAHTLVRQLGTDVVIRSTADLEQAVMDRTAIGDQIRVVETFFAPLKSMAHKLHATLCDRERIILRPLQMIDTARRSAISDYKRQQDDDRRAREHQLAEERQRDEQARATREAVALENAGHQDLADAVLAEAINAPAPVVVLPDTTKVAGLKFRRRWLWRYAGGPADVKTTPAPVVSRTLNMIPREFLCLDEKKIGQYATAMKSAGKIPGIEIYSVDDPVR